MSPLHTEIYLDAARKLLDRALVEGEKPPEIKWRFEVDSGDSDANRIRYDDQNPIVNGGNNRVEGGFKVVHHKSWDKGLNVRDFRVNHAGDYVVRIRAGGKVPTRAQVVASAEKILKSRWADQEKENPQGSRWHKEQYDRDLEHFKNDRMYDYGPPRIKLVQDVAGQPRTIAEFDVDAPHDQPKEYEVRTRLSTENAGLTIEYAYDIPRVLENFWLQGGEAFARPELWVDWMELEGPVHTSWPPASHVAVLPYSPKAKTDAKGYARDVLQKFMRKAWRRPATKPEVDEKYEMFLEAISEGYTGTEALKLPLASVLISPNFLFLTEPSSGANGRVLTDHELAARLSYFLWSSMPDDELSRLADAGKLKEKKTLAKQIDRMIAHPRSAELIDNFAGQWLQLREVGANPPAEDLYPQYDRHLELSIVEESKRFFEEILRNDLSVLNFVKSDFVVVNERLARYYGIPDVRGDHFRRVAVPPGVHRGGIVTQASILTVTSNGTRTSPVKRGTWVMKNVLGMDPGLPVANAGDIAPKVPGIDKATVRKRLEIHRELPQCARCHNKIDPLGFALENYNAAGEWRDQEGFGYKGRIERDDPKIDARSQLLDGTKIDGVDDLRDALLKQQDLFLNCLANKLTTYALGRELGLADQKLIKLAVAEMKTGKRTLRSLIHQIVNSDAFGRK